MTSATTPGYVVAPARPDDRDELLGLWSENLPMTDAAARFEWLYGGQPGRARSWVLRTGDGSLVGVAALADRSFHLRGLAAAGAQAIDFVIDRQHRSLGPAMELQRTVTGSLRGPEARIGYALPNRKSEPVLIRSGYRRIGAMHRWSRVLRFDRFVPAGLRSGRLRQLAAGTIAVADRALAPDRWWRRPGWRVATRAGFDRRFDDLSQAAARQFGMVGERSADYLTWRFRRHPATSYELATLEDRAGLLLGYIVYYVEGDVLRVADTLAIDLRAWRVLTAALLRRARRMPVTAATIVYFGSPAFEGMLRSFGFRQRASDTSVLVFGDAAVPPPAEWHLTEADRDV